MKDKAYAALVAGLPKRGRKLTVAIHNIMMLDGVIGGKAMPGQALVVVFDTLNNAKVGMNVMASHGFKVCGDVLDVEVEDGQYFMRTPLLNLIMNPLWEWGEKE